MRIFIDIDTSRIIRTPGSALLLDRLDFKRGASAFIEVLFFSGLNQVRLLPGASGFLGFKPVDEFDGDLVVSDDTWDEVEDADGLYSYFFNPEFNTVPLNVLLGHDGAGGDVSNDVPFVDLMMEVKWNENGSIGISQTVTGRIYNNVIKSGEGLPSSGTPVYPSAGDINAAIADIDAIEARDWVEVPTNSIDGNQPPSAWQDGVVSIMAVAFSSTYPVSSGLVLVDRRNSSNTREFRTNDNAGNNIYIQGLSPDSTWIGDWKQQATTDEVVDLTTAQTAAGEKTFTDELRATGQTAVDGSSVMTRDLGDRRYTNPLRSLNYSFNSGWNSTVTTGGSLDQLPQYLGVYASNGVSAGSSTATVANDRAMIGATSTSFATGVQFVDTVNANITMRNRVGNGANERDWAFIFGGLELTAAGISNMVKTGSAAAVGWVGLQCIAGNVTIIAVDGAEPVSSSSTIDTVGAIGEMKSYRLEVSGGAANCYDASGELLGTLATGCPTTLKSYYNQVAILTEAKNLTTTNELGIVVQHLSFDW